VDWWIEGWIGGVRGGLADRGVDWSSEGWIGGLRGGFVD
jgi:hypothetical protein